MSFNNFQRILTIHTYVRFDALQAYRRRTSEKKTLLVETRLQNISEKNEKKICIISPSLWNMISRRVLVIVVILL